MSESVIFTSGTNVRIVDPTSETRGGSTFNGTWLSPPLHPVNGSLLFTFSRFVTIGIPRGTGSFEVEFSVNGGRSFVQTNVFSYSNSNGELQRFFANPHLTGFDLRFRLRLPLRNIRIENFYYKLNPRSAFPS